MLPGEQPHGLWCRMRLRVIPQDIVQRALDPSCCLVDLTGGAPCRLGLVRDAVQEHQQVGGTGASGIG